MLPVVATPPATLPPAGDLVRACAFEVSCFHDPPSAVLADCIGYLQAGIAGLPALFAPPLLDAGDYRRWADCGAASHDCAGALDCATLGHGADYCAAHPGTTCDGDLLVPCPPAGATAEAALFTIDCAARGMRCLSADGSASCSDGIACDPKSFAPSCDGNRYVELCDDTTHLRYRLDCARSPIPNATCRSGPNIAAACMPSGAPCTANRCDGDVLQSCIAGEEVAIDCAQRAGHCMNVGANPTCVPVAGQCDANDKDQCVDARLESCVDGVVQSVACAELGLAACTLTPGLNPRCG